MERPFSRSMRGEHSLCLATATCSSRRGANTGVPMGIPATGKAGISGPQLSRPARHAEVAREQGLNEPNQGTKHPTKKRTRCLGPLGVLGSPALAV